MAAASRRHHGEGGRQAATLGRGGDAGRREERRGGMVEHGHGAAVDSLLEMTSGREAFGEDEWTRGYDVGPLGWYQPANGGVRTIERPSVSIYDLLYIKLQRICIFASKYKVR